MKTEIKQFKAGRASRTVALAAVLALGASTVATPAAAIQDDGRMVEENALLLHGQIAGFGENGFYVDPTVFVGIFKAPWIMLHKGLIGPLQLLGGLGDLFPREGYRDQ